MPAPKDTNPEFEQFAHPEKLVSTEWVQEHLDHPDVVIVESDEDVLLYETGHIPGAVKVDWHMDLNDPVTRDYVDGEAFAELMSRKGISRDTTVVFYGDNFNWWAAYALWVFTLFGHPDVRLMDGGRKKWADEDRPMTTDVPEPEPTDYPVVERNDAPIRAFQPEVLAHVEEGGRLVDVRSPQEFSGELLHMPDYPQEGTLRGGHIPGAVNVPWKRAAEEEDATFKGVEELRAIYEGEQGLSADDDVVAYCRIGERSSHTWFVLTYLLGYPDVRNYDGSWTEWGNMVRVPIERGDGD
jgi:thiosulfate/3-mercaptopyruvate sulfurtransferase